MMKRALAPLVAASFAALAALPGAARAIPHTPQLLVVTNDVTLDDDWHGSVVVATPNVTLDCAGHSIIGPGFDNGGEEFGGIQVEPETSDGAAVTDVVIRNCNIVNHIGGVGVGADETTLDSNTVDGSARGTGGFSIFSNDNLIVNNSATNVEFDGFLLRGDEFGESVRGNVLRGNFAQNNVSNFSLEFADNNELVDNIAEGDGAVGLGYQVAFSDGNHLESNTAVGVEVGFALADAESNELEANTAVGGSGWSAGFGMWSSHENRLTNNLIEKAVFGFLLEGSTANTIEHNSFTEPHQEESTGLFLEFGSDENTVEGNRFDNLTVGISLDGSSFNSVEDNTVLRSTENGFNLLGAHNNVIEGNRSQHNDGNGYWVFFSDDNLFESNAANVNGDFGIFDFGGIGNAYSDNKCGGNASADSSPDGLC